MWQGRRFGPYVIEAWLGSGGMATVWRVRHEVLQTTHALKVLFDTGPDMEQRLRLEGRVQAALRHINVVRVTEIVPVDETYGLVLDFVDGPPLDRLIRHRPLHMREVDQLARGILAGTIAAHDLGCVHRDLKPANILVESRCGELVPRITDFGLVKVLDGKERLVTRAGTRLGTPGYMCREQVHQSPPEPGFDIFALGAILFELCERRPAFRTLDAWEASLTGRAPYPSVTEPVPEHWRSAIAHALCDAPDRFRTCRDLWGAWTDEPAPALAVPAAEEHPDAERLCEEYLTPTELAHVAACLSCRLERQLAQRARQALEVAPRVVAEPHPSPSHRTWRWVAGTLVVVGAGLRWGSPPEASRLDDPSRWEAVDLYEAEIWTPPKRPGEVVDRTGWISSALVHDGRLFVIPAEASVLYAYDASMPMTAPDAWRSFDAAQLVPDAATQRQGSSWAVADEHYVYVAPLGDHTALRYDLRQPFSSVASWSTYDLLDVVPPSPMLGLAAFDGRYVYLGPRDDGHVVRYDTHAPFGDPTSWTTGDLGGAVGLRGPFSGGRFDGRIGAKNHGDERYPVALASFSQAVFDGRHVSWVPHHHGDWWGTLVQLDTEADFSEDAAWSSFDLRQVAPRAEGFSGGVTDGRHLYLAPLFGNRSWWHGLVLRHDLSRPVTNLASWQTQDLAELDERAVGYQAIAFDGRHIVLAPHGGGWGAQVARYDTVRPFNGAGWATFDLTRLSLQATAYAAVASDHRSVWLLRAPTNERKPALMTRFDAR